MGSFLGAAVFYLPPGVSPFLRTLFPLPPPPTLAAFTVYQGTPTGRVKRMWRGALGSRLNLPQVWGAPNPRAQVERRCKWGKPAL